MPKIFQIIACLLLLLLNRNASAQTLPFGQWIWTQTDKTIFQDAKQKIPQLVPTVWIATLFYENEQIRTQLALSPGIVAAPVGVVVRLDDSMHTAFRHRKPSDWHNALNTAFFELLTHLKSYNIVEFELDYDCPVALLPHWSEALTALQSGPLQKQNLWITSLVAHMRSPQYSTLFQKKISGHILQLFDTGTTEDATEILQLAQQQGIAFRVGLGAYERQSPQGDVTQHREWFGDIPLFAQNDLFQGIWIFPAGHSWTGLVKKYW